MYLWVDRCVGEDQKKKSSCALFSSGYLRYEITWWRSVYRNTDIKNLVSAHQQIDSTLITSSSALFILKISLMMKKYEFWRINCNLWRTCKASNIIHEFLMFSFIFSEINWLQRCSVGLICHTCRALQTVSREFLIKCPYFLSSGIFFFHLKWIFNSELVSSRWPRKISLSLPVAWGVSFRYYIF